MNIAIANAPVSYGAFELTVGIDPSVPDGTAVLDEVAAAGYGGIDLGPVGYLGRGRTSSPSASRAGARPGRRVPGVPLLRSGGARLALPRARRDARHLRRRARRRARAAAAPDDRRRGQRRAPGGPGRSSTDRSRGLDAEGWARFGEGLRAVVALPSRPWLRADASPRDGHLRRGALGGRSRHGAVRRRRVPRDGSPATSAAATRRVSRATGRVGSTTFTSRTRTAW